MFLLTPWWVWLIILYFGGFMLYGGIKQAWAESNPFAPPGGQMTGHQFEHHCAMILRAQGWDAHVTQASGDQGVDVIARRGGTVLALQCKLWNSAVGNSAVQEAHAGRSFVGANAAAVVATAGYTEAARQLAARTRVSLLSLADLERINAIFKV